MKQIPNYVSYQVIDDDTEECIKTEEVFDLKVKFKNQKSSKVTELILLDKIQKHNDLKTCASNLTEFIPVEKFELYQTKENQIVLYEPNKNLTHNWTDFCIDTRYDAKINWNKTYAKICHSLCANELSTCVQFCCPKGKFAGGIFGKCVPYNSKDDYTNWRPKALTDAEQNGLGRALYDMRPKCFDSFNIDSYKTSHPLDVLENGNLDWGKELYF